MSETVILAIVICEKCSFGCTWDCWGRYRNTEYVDQGLCTGVYVGHINPLDDDLSNSILFEIVSLFIDLLSKVL